MRFRNSFLEKKGDGETIFPTRSLDDHRFESDVVDQNIKEITSLSNL